MTFIVELRTDQQLNLDNGRDSRDLRANAISQENTIPISLCSVQNLMFQEETDV